MEFFLKLCAFVGVTSVVRDSAAVGPIQSYLLQYKRSILANSNAAGLDGLAAFNGFGGTPFNLAAGTPYDFGGYGQRFASYSPGAGLPAPSAYGFGDLRLHQTTTRGFGASPAADFALQYAGAPYYGGYGLDATGSAGYPFAAAAPQHGISPQPSPIASLPQLYALAGQRVPAAAAAAAAAVPPFETAAPPKMVQSNGVPVAYSNEPTKASTVAPHPVPYTGNGQLLLPNPEVGPRLRYPTMQDVRQVQLSSRPAFGTASDPADDAAAQPARFQIPLSYRPRPDPENGDRAAAPPPSSPSAFAPGTAETPNLFLELTPPPYSEPPTDYSKSPNPSSSPSGNSHVDFGPVPSGSDSSDAGNHDSAPYAVPAAGDSNSPAGRLSSGSGGASNPPSDSYIVPSISYSLPDNTQTYGGHTADRPNAVNSYYGPSVSGAEMSKTAAANSVPNTPNRFASNHLYGESADSSAPVASSGSNAASAASFLNAYYNVPVNIPSDAYRGDTSVSYRSHSNPTSANTYSESNSIQSGSYGNAKPVPGNVFSDSNSISTKKRESSNFGQLDNESSPLNYYSNAGNDKHVR